MQPSVVVFVYILSSEGANKLQVLYIGILGVILGNIQGKFSTEAAVLKFIPSNIFLDTCRSFRKTSENLSLKNYVLAYHAANKDHAEIL